MLGFLSHIMSGKREIPSPFFEWEEARERLVVPLFGHDLMSEISQVEEELKRRKLWKPFVEFEECYVKRTHSLHDISAFKVFMEKSGAKEGTDFSYGKDSWGYWIAIRIPISEQAREGWSRAMVYRIVEDAVFEAVRRNLKERTLLFERFMESLVGHLLRFRFRKVRFIQTDSSSLRKLVSEGYKIRFHSVSTVGCGFRVNFFVASKGDVTVFLLPVRVVKHEA